MPEKGYKTFLFYSSQFSWWNKGHEGNLWAVNLFKQGVVAHLSATEENNHWSFCWSSFVHTSTPGKNITQTFLFV